MTEENMKELIASMTTVSDNLLDAHGRKLCADFDQVGGDPVRFLRDLLDLSVRYAWSSGLMISSLKIILDGHPESEESKKARRTELLRKWEPNTPLSEAG